MNQVNTNDKRSLKTRKAIKNAFVTLLQKKDIDAISITELSQLAHINRKTFYMHYASIYEVMDEIETHVITSLNEMLEQTNVIQDCYDPHVIFDFLSEVLKDDPQYYQYLLNTQSHSTILMKLKTVMKPRIVTLLMLNFSLEQKKVEYCVEFILAGAIALYQQWLDGNRTQDIEEVSEIANLLASQAVETLIQTAQIKEI